MKNKFDMNDDIYIYISFFIYYFCRIWTKKI